MVNPDVSTMVESTDTAEEHCQCSSYPYFWTVGYIPDEDEKQEDTDRCDQQHGYFNECRKFRYNCSERLDN